MWEGCNVTQSRVQKKSQDMMSGRKRAVQRDVWIAGLVDGSVDGSLVRSGQIGRPPTKLDSLCLGDAWGMPSCAKNMVMALEMWLRTFCVYEVKVLD